MRTIRIGILTFMVLLTFRGFSQGYHYLTKWYSKNESAGFYLGYVNQQFQIKFGDYSDYTDGIWEDRSRLHGLSLGVAYQSNWLYGFGLYCGGTMEFYLSTNNPTAVYHANYPREAYDIYGEFTFQIPLHLALKVPLGYDFSLGFHTGLGTTLTWFSLFTDSRGYFDDVSPLDMKTFKFYNFTYDFALYVELFNFRLDAQWSTGLNNQQPSSNWDNLTRNKFSIGLTIFPSY